MKEFEDQVVVITGAAGGIGCAIAMGFHDKGAKIVIADRDEQGLSRIVEARQMDRDRMLAVQYDASLPENAERLVAASVERFGRIDHLVPAAAIYEDQPFLSMTDEQWLRTIQVNLNGIFYICRRALPHMRPGGSIVAIASSAGHEGCSPEHVHYGASKAGVLGFAKSLAKEIAPDFRVNVVSPGTIRTPMVEEVLKKRGEQFLAVTPAGRFGEADEVAAAVVFLCSASASYITGSTVHVNGGSYMGG